MRHSQWLTAYLATVTLVAAAVFAAIGSPEAAQVLVGAAVGVVGGAATSRASGS